MRLLRQLEALQEALWRHAAARSGGATLRRFRVTSRAWPKTSAGDVR